MRVLFLNHMDESGAGKACLKIVESLKNRGIKCDFKVKVKLNNDKSSKIIDKINPINSENRKKRFNRIISKIAGKNVKNHFKAHLYFRLDIIKKLMKVITI